MKRGIMAVAAMALLAGTAFAQQAPAAAQSVPARVIQQDTTTVYDVSTTNKRGTTQYGMVAQTQTTPQGGTRIISQTAYEDYSPSKMALANQKKGEVSLGVGASYTAAKDSAGARLSDVGWSGTAQVMWDMTDHLALGVDYMLLAPHSRNNHRGNGSYKYSDLRYNGVGLAGKYTLNAWDTWRVYIPMGVGAAQVRMKSAGKRGGVATAQSDDKWGLDLFAGLGLQYNLTKDLFMGLEYRYTVAFVKSDDLNRYYGKNQYFQFHGAFLRMGMRF